jgi:choline dehydrogenase-like flavoprotein
MKVAVVGAGAGGATAARKLAQNGFEVTLLEAGNPFSPLTHKIAWLSSLRGSWLIKDEGAIKHFFPHYRTLRSSADLAIFVGVTEGGCTSIACGCMVRAQNGLKEIGLDLTPEYEEIERQLPICTVPRERWRPLSQKMFDQATKHGLDPTPTPRACDLQKCVGCGYCELGCNTGAKWDSRRLYTDLLGKGITLQTQSCVQKIIVENGVAKGVMVAGGSSVGRVDADVVVLAAGGIGTSQILRASNLPVSDRLWVDVLLTVGGVCTDARMLSEPPMVWFAKAENYILSPYFDLLSYWFHKPWKDVSAKNRVGMMIKLADVEQGSVAADGAVTKSLTDVDKKRLSQAREKAITIMQASGVVGPFVDGMLHGGHIGGTVPLSAADVGTMHPEGLAENLWVADLSLMPRSQGMPTMLTTQALSLRVAKKIIEHKRVEADGKN